ncbi:MAG: DUF4493 domain-containing protein [Flavobacteriales bacterium]|nr:DUF4493 domain-containing protein [Flavobacteriales bacterium]
MKKIVFLATLALLSVSCSKSVEKTEYGTLNMSLTSSEPTIEVTKANSAASDDYSVQITNSATTPAFSNTYSYGVLKATPLTLIAAENYALSAESCTKEIALSANSNFGQPRYAGATTFNITANTKTDVPLTCTMANAKVSVAYNNASGEFTTAFSSYSTQIYEVNDADRKLDFASTATVEGPFAYFNIAESNPKIVVVVTATRSSDGAVKTFSSEHDLAAAKWIKLTFSISSTSGQGDFTINVDESIEEIDKPVNIDPYL